MYLLDDTFNPITEAKFVTNIYASHVRITHTNLVDVETPLSPQPNPATLQKRKRYQLSGDQSPPMCLSPPAAEHRTSRREAVYFQQGLPRRRSGNTDRHRGQRASRTVARRARRSPPGPMFSFHTQTGRRDD